MNNFGLFILNSCQLHSFRSPGLAIEVNLFRTLESVWVQIDEKKDSSRTVFISIGSCFIGNTRHEQYISTVHLLPMLSFKNLQEGAIKDRWLPFNKLLSTNKPESNQRFCIISICYILSQINLKACNMQSTFIKRLSYIHFLWQTILLISIAYAWAKKKKMPSSGFPSKQFGWECRNKYGGKLLTFDRTLLI